MVKRAIVLVNVGTPDQPTVGKVRKYLSEFLNDPRVIDLPWLLRKILVNFIIVPFRAPKSTKLYRQLWSDKGSPLLYHLMALTDALQKETDDHTDVFGAMRYGNPSLRNVLETVRKGNYDEIVILPLYPQYASSTTGSVIGAAMRIIRNWEVIPAIRIISQFHAHPAFTGAFAEKIKSCLPENFDHVLFSYHGLPNRQINKIHPDVTVGNCRCETEVPAHGKFCYRAACYQTTRLLVSELGLSPGRYSTAFQSRLSKNWMTPFADETIAALAEKGVRKLLVVAPSFVADCLETTVEIGKEYEELFRRAGGEKLVLAESLNSDPAWAKAITVILK